ncbi:MAG: hypothetical protein Q7J02_05225 [Rhodocyclaceae bacterium]|nr:hypothetical protein [Rhodocyclaceae bacterium]
MMRSFLVASELPAKCRFASIEAQHPAGINMQFETECKRGGLQKSALAGRRQYGDGVSRLADNTGTALRIICTPSALYLS